MANGEILTAEQERQLRQQIYEYVGKIQKEIDERFRKLKEKSVSINIKM